MMELAVILSQIIVIVSKVPDFITTWNGVSLHGPDWEQNIFARYVIKRYGLSIGLLVVFVIYLAVIAATMAVHYNCTGVWYSISGYTIITYSLFLAVVQLQAAYYNTTGKMLWPLTSVAQSLRNIYQQPSRDKSD